VNASFLHSIGLSFALLLLVQPTSAQTPAAAPAQPRDAPTLKTIDLAINTHYLATNFDTAEKLLRAAIEDCQNQCSSKVLAKAYSYLGMVLVTGKNDRSGATDAFIRALSLDPALKIDAALATPEVNEIFQGLGAAGTPTTSVPLAQPAATATPGAQATLVGPFNCTPTVTEVETRRPIPVQCRTSQEVAVAQLRYKLPATKSWVTVAMTKKGNSYVAEIACKETETIGTLELYARAEDAGGEDVGAWGSKAAPIQIQLVQTSKQEPPSLRDAEPPPRCAEKQECPPDFPGCAVQKKGGDTDWGGGCNNSGECKAGLLCIDGTCENAPSCTTDDDCSVGRCVANKCSAIETEGGLSHARRKNWFGLHVAQDLALVSGTDPCTQANQSSQNWACYYRDSGKTPYLNDPQPGVKVGGGLARATTRILASYDRVLGSNVTAGARVGFAFGGAPTSFMPVHLELRAAYWFGQEVFTRKFRPYVHLGGGLAAVDVKFEVPTQENCAAGSGCKNGVRNVDLDAWKRLGLEFVTLGGGLAYAITPMLALNANLNVMYMFPSTAPVLEPSIGVMAGL
jgi:hypothetical protein